MELQHPSLLQQEIFIGNEWRKASNNEVFSVLNPANGNTIAQVANGSIDDLETAIQAAHNAFLSWSQKTGKERAQLLRKWFELCQLHEKDLAVILSSEQGKPYEEALGEIRYGSAYIEWFAEEAKRNYGKIIPSPQQGKRTKTIVQPIGVAACITPWNFPNAMLARKIAPALAAGCTVVCKPASETPLSALALAQLAKEAGIPAHVIQVIPSTHSKIFGEHLCTHPNIAKLTFTGSTEVGRILMAQSGSTLKKLSLELGGNAPFIVFESADLTIASQGLIQSKFRNAGQTCVCTNRAYVHKNIEAQFLQALIPQIEALKIGNGLEKGVQIGPLISQKAIDKINDLVEDALQKGAQIAYQSFVKNDLFLGPLVLTNCNHTMRLSQEEIFGPVLAIYTFESQEEAIALANDTVFGLAAYFYTENRKQIIHVAEQLQYGIIGINEGLISHAEVPFGGVKQSGFGKEGGYLGIEDYQIVKYICEGNL